MTDPAEIAAAEAQSRQYKQTALGQIGCWMVVDAPLPLLAQHIVELPPEDQQEFLNELLSRLPADALRRIEETLRSASEPPPPDSPESNATPLASGTAAP